MVIVLHTTLGAFNGAVDWLRTTPEQRQARHGKKTYSSAHAVFGRYGEVAKLAEVDKGTWHAGSVSKPSQLAKSMLPKYWNGRLKNPNRATLGLEFASGYDIDRDGTIEAWEKLYTQRQVDACVEYIIAELEPAMKKFHNVDIKFDQNSIITHRDIAYHKPNLEIQKAMVLATLARRRDEIANPKPVTAAEPAPKPTPPREATELKIEDGGKLIIEKTSDNKLFIRKA